jgi:hypothetical protein
MNIKKGFVETLGCVVNPVDTIKVNRMFRQELVPPPPRPTPD